MKILYIGLELETGDRDNRMYRSDFMLRNRFIGNYLQRALKLMGVTTQNFNRIIISCKEERVLPLMIENKFLKIELLFDRKAYESQSAYTLPEFFCELYSMAFQQAKDVPSFPYEALIESLNSFRRSGYLNEWSEVDKNLRQIDTHASVKSKMTMDRFSMRLILERNASIIYENEIFSSAPDEILFAGKAKSITYDNHQISVINSLQGRIFYTEWPIIIT